MQHIFCPHCGKAVFDPSKVWTSPGPFIDTKTGKPSKTVVQCPNCKKWMLVVITGGNATAEKPDKS